MYLVVKDRSVAIVTPITTSVSLNEVQNGNFLCKAYFVGHFCYHSNGKSYINMSDLSLHLHYSSNKPIKRFVCLFDLILYVPSTIFQLCRDESSWVEPVLS